MEPHRLAAKSRDSANNGISQKDLDCKKKKKNPMCAINAMRRAFTKASILDQDNFLMPYFAGHYCAIHAFR